ncbi:MAG: LCP family protein [Clostridia bacterium]|nr:LCP family protein [Clostridia bacterium]
MHLNKIFNNKKALITLISIILLIAIAVVCIIVAVSDTDDIAGSETTTGIPADNNSNVLSGDSTFLVVITDESNDIVLPLLAEFKIYSKCLVLTPLDKDTLSSDGRSYSECYSYGGINLLESSVEGVRNVDIDRYAVINKSGFNRLTELMGEVSLYINEDFTYATSDKTYTVTMGNNDMGSDMLFTYIALLAERENGETAAAEIVCTVVNSYLQNLDSYDSEELFGDVTNCFSTNVTISDYYTAESDISYLIENGFECILSSGIDG